MKNKFLVALQGWFITASVSAVLAWVSFHFGFLATLFVYNFGGSRGSIFAFALLLYIPLTLRVNYSISKKKLSRAIIYVALSPATWYLVWYILFVM